MDIDISYIVDIPPIITTLNTSDLNWKRGIVTFTEYDIWFPYADQVNIVPLKAIKLIDRQLPPSIMKKIHYTSREADLLVVEYQKKSTFGIGYINSIMLFAGPGSSINKIKSYLSSILGIQVNAKYGNLNKEELRLLCLLAAGMNDVDLLIPLFDSNKALIKRSFTVLKDKNLVDDCASITQLGSEYVESIKGNGEGKLGKIARDPFGSVPQPHKAVDSFKPKKDTIKFRKRYKSSSIEGLVSIRHIGQFIQTEEINNLKKEELPFGELALNLRTMNGISISIEPSEKSITLALFNVFDSERDTQSRILNSIYIGIKEIPDISVILKIDPAVIKIYLDSMINNKLITINNDLSSTGIIKVKNELGGDNTSNVQPRPNNIRKPDKYNLEEEKERLLNQIGGI